jgi:hypothetical protein
MDWLRGVAHPNVTLVPERDKTVLDAAADDANGVIGNIHRHYPVIKGTPQPAKPRNFAPARQIKGLEQYILLAPYADTPDMQWQHWPMLCAQLLKAGRKVAVIGPRAKADAMKAGFPGARLFWALDAAATANLVRGAQLVIVTESVERHIAELYSVNAIALSAQTDAGQSATTRVVTPPESVPCRLCKRAADVFLPVCNILCSALQLISPFEIADLALQTIGVEREGISSQARGRQVDLSGTAIPWIQPASSGPQGQPEEKDGAGEEGRRSETGEVWPAWLRGFHAAQRSEAQRELPQAVSGDKGKVRAADKKRRVQREPLGAQRPLVRNH